MDRQRYINEPVVTGIFAKLVQKIDDFLDWLYRYRGSCEALTTTDNLVWAIPPSPKSFPWDSTPHAGQLRPEIYFEHYFQSQGCGPTKNECVTTAVVMSMNMIKDRIAARWGFSAGMIPDQTVEKYTCELDHAGIRGWRYRFPTGSLLSGMMTPWQAVWALKDFSETVKTKYGRTCTVQLSSGHTLQDLVQSLRCGKIVLVHGARRMTLSCQRENHSPWLPWMGGRPHTMILVGYDGPSDQWIFLNPAKPWLTDGNHPECIKLHRMSTVELMDFWGRQFLFYPPRFSITVISWET